MTADCLKKGIPALIISVSGEKALGATAGAPMILLRTAPFGDPLIFAVKDTRFAIRKADAKGISVRYDKYNWTKRIFV